MRTDMESLYPKYVDYVTRLQEHLDAVFGAGVPETRRATPLSLEGFSAMWNRWSGKEGLRERWLRRFTHGYESEAAACRRRLEKALNVCSPRGGQAVA